MLALLLALALDLCLGEPTPKLHPVVWMGRYLSLVKRHPAEPRTAFWRGLSLLLVGAGIVSALAWGSVYLVGRLPGWLEPILLAILLKPMFSLRALLQAGEEVRSALGAADLNEARRLLSWHLVSRDTAHLSESEVAGAAVESLAENFTDSVVAPLVYFALLGLPGAALYRFVNTADAVLGYRTAELEYLGKSSARLDDALNFIPARLSAALLTLSLGLLGGSASRAHRAAASARLPSPNAGWTMGAVAGGLGVRLDKRGVYVLNPSGRPARPEDIRRVTQVVVTATLLLLTALLGLGL